MTTLQRRGCALAAISFFGFSVHAQQSRIAGPVDSSRRVTLAGHVPARARRGTDLGRAPGTFALPAVTLMLKPSATQQAALGQLLQDLQDPASPKYHQWLTPEQYADQFGASQADIAQISAWLQSQGFNVLNVARSRMWITASGTAAQAEAAFRTEIHQYQAEGAAHYANATDPSVPAAIAPLVASIRGLHDFHPRPRLRAPVPGYNTGGGFHALAPDDVATIYDIAPLYQAGIDGTGQSLVVVGQTALQTSDLQSFRTKFNLPALNLQQVLVPRHPNPGVSPDDLNEANLDLEWSGAVARNAKIIYVYSNDVFTSATYAIDSKLAPVLSMSYGMCEQSDLGDLPSFQQLAQQANAQGMTWFAAAGDSGAADCDDYGTAVAQNGLAVDVPASIPEVTAMGGTEFNEQGASYWAAANGPNGGSALSYIPEKVWNDTAIDQQLSAGGGGTSVVFSRPVWQGGPGVPGDRFRHVPDISFSASADHDPYYVVVNGQGTYFGGTSVGAPLMAGVTTLLNHYLASNGAAGQPGLGNINPALYRLAQTSPAAFHDVQTGDNSAPCASGTPDCTGGSFGYTAVVNYDQASGLGSVDVNQFVHLWTGAPAHNSGVAASIDQNPVFQQAPDASGNRWRFQITLREEAGVATTLQSFTIDGASYPVSLFNSTAIPANGSIAANVGLSNVAVPKTVVFTFSGTDASGASWTTQMAVPFDGTQTPLTVAGISNAASGQQAFAPGELLAVYGTALGTATQSAAAIPLPLYLAGFEATINGVPAPLYYVSPNQVNVQIPYETQAGPATLTVGNPFTNLNFNFTVAGTAPGIFTFTDGSVNPSRTGAKGQEVFLYVTGEGAVSPSLATGDTPAAGTPLSRLPKPVQPVTVTVGGIQASVQFIGIPPGLVGVTQINFTIPPNVPSGPQPVVVTVGGVASNTATIHVQ
ncbi:MAG TPA: protease pro-enzyme activation domain-containing protein [Bryobacteraceae bacterium]|nr:protease pro-enzyme activation domain-containing protein [Bryobacteraceae bacterium]